MTEKNTRLAPTAPAAVASDSKALNYATRVIVILVALGAAVLSFDALTSLAESAGIRREFSWVWAVVIDGFIMVATFAAFALRDRDGKSKYYAWTTLVVFVLFSIGGNAWHAAIATEGYVLPIEAAVVVTAIPPLALFLAIHLLILMVSPSHEQKEEMIRLRKKQERLRIIEEKELERIEKAALIRDINESKASQIVSVTPVPVQPSLKPIPPIGEAPLAIQRVDMQAIEEAPTGLAVVMSEAQVEVKLLELHETGEQLPTGKTVAQWLGKSERTGQNLLKKFRETLES